MNNNYSFIPGERKPSSAPLERFLPNIEEGVASEWIVRYLEKSNRRNKNGLILDPFGASPSLVKEFSKSGYPALVIAPNPIMYFLIEKTIRPFQKQELLNALAQLSRVPVGAQRLEIFIKKLYKSNCIRCNNEVIPHSFVWDSNEDIPIYKNYECEQCFHKGEFPTSTEDILLAKSFRHTGLHKSWLVEKVIHGNQALRKNVEDALDVYSPRALTAIFTLLTSLEKIPENLIDPLNYLLISCFDRASALWHYPTSKSKLKLLTKPSRYFEHNIWYALEEALGNYSSAPYIDAKIILHNWQINVENFQGVYLYGKKLFHFEREFRNQKSKNLPIAAVITAIPRYNQAFWTLSAIWTGWLLGKEAATSFISILQRKRYDWTWHTSALKSIFTICSRLLEDRTPIFGLINELEPSFFSAAVLAALLSNFNLQGYAARSDTKQAQLYWIYDSLRPLSVDDNSTRFSLQNLDQEIHDSITKQIMECNEPIPYTSIHSAILDALVKTAQEKSTEGNNINYAVIGDIQNNIQEILTGSSDFLHYEGSPKNIASGFWWLRNYVPESYTTLTDRIENAVVSRLIDGNPSSFRDVDMDVCYHFPGNLTPDKQKVMMCLDAYAELVTPEDKLWVLRDQEKSLQREADINEIINILMIMGKNLDYDVSMNAKNSIVWFDELHKPDYQFVVTHDAIINEIVQTRKQSAKRDIIVIPGGRANLILFKLNHNTFLRNRVNDGWIFMKFRLVRKLSAIHNLSREDFTNQLNTDQLVYQDPQIPLF